MGAAKSYSGRAWKMKALALIAMAKSTCEPCVGSAPRQSGESKTVLTPRPSGEKSKNSMDTFTAPAFEILISLAIGIGLSAACGFRVFVPFLVMSIAAQAGYLELAPGWEWIGTTPALIAFAIAAILEVVAYYVPWLDNLLDTIATPAAVIAGVVATAAVVSGISPFLTWTLAAIAGGGAAGLIQSGTVLLRGMSSSTTMGVGNFAVSTGELAGSFILSVLSFVLPIFTLILVLFLVFWIWRRLNSRRRLAT
jgi:hypothetical protein